MAFTVQNDIGTQAGANSYVTSTEFKEYHKDRGNSVSAYSTSQIQAAIVRATDYLDLRFAYIGERSQSPQDTEWPRTNAFDIEEDLVNGVPTEVKEATYEYALISLSATINPIPLRDDTGQTVTRKKERVGPIEEDTRYTEGPVFTMPKYPPADLKLIRRGLVIQGGTMRRAD